MIQVKKEGILLAGTANGFENEGVLNPAVIEDNGVIHLFYRAVSRGNYSSIGYCKLSDPLTIEYRSDCPLLFPQLDYESRGVEDPRISKIDGLFFLSYTAYDGVNALGALAISGDLLHFEKMGLIVPQIAYEEFSHLAESKAVINEKYLRYNEIRNIRENLGRKLLIWDKNVVFFPKRINGKICFLHRIRPDIQLVAVNELHELTAEYWQHYFLHFDEYIVMAPKYKHEVSYIGAGCPPVETAHGWLLIYHGVHDTVDGYVYSAGAALLDLQQPQKEISRLPYALFKPELEWELTGEVNNVCFPTGCIRRGDRLYIYYGAADERIATASVNIHELLDELLKYKI
ncbi:MAG: pesticidal protein Cry7Aa [Sphingobacteriales bacterium]|nr:pesticidal protein Cry7Aa [Sphingobacteriales bacterium]